MRSSTTNQQINKLTINKTGKKPQTMAELLASQNASFVAIHKGAMIPGVITKLTSSEILVDISTKAEAVVLEKDKKILNVLLSSLSVGDKVTVQILNPESDMGNPVVSLRRFLDDKLWKKIVEYKEKKEVLDITVNDVVRGGFLVSTSDGISGFLPNSQVSFVSQSAEAGVDGSGNFIGHSIKAIILETDRESHKIIFSQTKAMGTEDFDKEIKKLKTGQMIKGIVTNVSQFGIFISVPIEDHAIDGFIHISDISWDKISDLATLYKAGDNIEASIIGFDKETRRVNLSIKSLAEDPFKERAKDFPIDKKVEATVVKISPSGVILDLGNEMTGLIRKDKIPPKITYKTGDVVEAVISSIEESRRRIILVPSLTEKPIGYR